MTTRGAYSTSVDLPHARTVWGTLTLTACALAALIEGYDTQAMGVAGPPLIRELGLSAGQAGVLFASGTLGQVIGAAAGGRIADFVGQQRALTGALLLVSLCSLLTPVQTGVTSLIVLRALCGLGLGAAVPNFISIAAGVVTQDRRLRTVTLLMTTFPIGGTIASVCALHTGLGWDWRMIFILGGVLPLVLGLIFLVLPTAPNHRGPTLQSRRTPGLATVLFGLESRKATLLLWTAFFFTQLVTLLLLNWLPTLIVRSGFSEQQASWTQVCFSVGGAVGGFVIRGLQQRIGRKGSVVTTYAAICISLFAVSLAHQSFSLVLIAASFAGAFIIGATLALYATAPLYYSSAVRASGVGSAVASGRLGSVAGPLIASALLTGGLTAGAVILCLEPFALAGALAAFALCYCPEQRE